MKKITSPSLEQNLESQEINIEKIEINTIIKVCIRILTNSEIFL